MKITNPFATKSLDDILSGFVKTRTELLEFIARSQAESDALAHVQEEIEQSQILLAERIDQAASVVDKLTEFVPAGTAQ